MLATMKVQEGIMGEGAMDGYLHRCCMTVASLELGGTHDTGTTYVHTCMVTKIGAPTVNGQR